MGLFLCFFFVCLFVCFFVLFFLGVFCCCCFVQIQPPFSMLQIYMLQVSLDALSMCGFVFRYSFIFHFIFWGMAGVVLYNSENNWPFESKITLKKAKIADSVLLSLFVNSNVHVLCNNAQASYHFIEHLFFNF